MKFFFERLKKITAPYSAAIIAIAISVSSITLVATISGVGTNELNNEIKSLGLDGLALSKKEMTTAAVLVEDVFTMVKEQEGVEAATPVLVEKIRFEIASKEQQAFMWGIGSSADKVVSMSIINGRMINNSDIEGNKRICLIDEDIANRAFSRSNVINKNIDVQIGGSTTRFLIVGIVKKGSNVLNNLSTQMMPNFIYAPYTTIKELRNTNNYDQIVLKLSNESDAEVVKNELEKSLAKRNQQDSIVISDLSSQKQVINKILDLATIALTLLSTISLFVAGVSVLSSVNAAVSAKRFDIGIKKSIGARNSQIIFEFLIEIIISASLGIAFGIGLTIAVISAALSLVGFTLNINANIVIYGIVSTCLISVLLGIVPAIKAAAMRPVDALKRE